MCVADTYRTLLYICVSSDADAAAPASRTLLYALQTLTATTLLYLLQTHTARYYIYVFAYLFLIYVVASSMCLQQI